MPRKTLLETYLIEFIEKYSKDEIVDEKLYNKILSKSVAWNKKEVLDKMIDEMDTFFDYEEEEKFSYVSFIELLKQET
tara:strand:+ start:816 stop:1049 length:234 start_codon:yes stop_codon:yes gene_type:complete